MNKVTIREMLSSETPQLVQWLYAHKDVNQVNFETFRKNQVRVYVAEDETGILAFIPIQFVYRYDALAPLPGISSLRLAKACEAMTEFIKNKASEENIGEIWVQPSDIQFSKFLQHLGYAPITQETLCMHFNMKSESTNG